MDMQIVASIYEMRGEKEKAVKIYREMLCKNPNNQKAMNELRRLSTKSMNIQGLNKDMYNFFLRARRKNELIELERWLVGD